jgi:hypothetical protein
MEARSDRLTPEDGKRNGWNLSTVFGRSVDEEYERYGI